MYQLSKKLLFRPWLLGQYKRSRFLLGCRWFFDDIIIVVFSILLQNVFGTQVELLVKNKIYVRVNRIYTSMGVLGVLKRNLHKVSWYCSSSCCVSSLMLLLLLPFVAAAAAALLTRPKKPVWGESKKISQLMKNSWTAEVWKTNLF